MTESATPAATTPEGFPIDASTKYKIDAGQCECGYYKTWGFKVQNKKSGKMMPGHVTAEGFKIGEGDCPRWAKLASINKMKAEKKATAGTPQPPGTWIQEINHPLGTASAANSTVIARAATATAATPVGKPTGVIEQAGAQPTSQASSGNEPGHVVAFNVNGFTVTTTIAEGMAIIEQISACVRKALGTGVYPS
jgi:hypothetical protein